MAVQWMVIAFELYVATGVVFAALFVSLGIQQVDSAATHAPWGFRLIVMPGVAALWPWMLLRWRRAAAGARP